MSRDANVRFAANRECMPSTLETKEVYSRTFEVEITH